MQATGGGARRPRAPLAVWLVMLVALLVPAAAHGAGSVYVATSGENAVAQFGIGPSGRISALSPASVAAGMNPAGVAVSPEGKSVYVSNSGESTVSQYNVDEAAGKLSPKTPATVASGAGPLHEGIAVTPDDKSLYVTNFNDNSVSQYDIDALTGTLSPKTRATVATGKHPIGVAVTPDGKNAYVPDNEDGAVSQFDIDPLTGALSAKSPATVAAGSKPAGVAVSPDGKSAYVKNVGTVSQYDIDPLTGALSAKSPATVVSAPSSGTDDTTPIALTPDGKSAYVTNQSGVEPAILQYDIDSGGRLSPKTPASVATATQPSNIAVSLDGKSAYVTNTFSEKVSQYDIDPLTGALSAKSPATVGTRAQPLGIAAGPLPLAHKTTTSVSCSPATVVAGDATTCTATVSDAAERGQTTPTGTVSFASDGPGSFESAASCTLAETKTGVAACHVSYTPTATTATPVRTDTVTVEYEGDYRHDGSSGSTSVKVLSITLLNRGSFVLGDQSAALGSTVTFWGSQWSKLNKRSAGKAPAGFKGFAANTTANPPACGANWSTGTGNSPPPPAAPLPEYMAVIVASKVDKSGSTIFSGDTVHVVVVKTTSGYAPDPEHGGTGTVAGIIC